MPAVMTPRSPYSHVYSCPNSTAYCDRAYGPGRRHNHPYRLSLTMKNRLFSAIVCVASIVTLSHAGIDDALVAYWPFDEGTGTTVSDASGNNSEGTVHGAVWARGVANTALEFRGEDYVQCVHRPAQHLTDSLSISVWVYLTEYPTSKVSWGWRDVINKAGAYQLCVNAGMGVTLRAMNDGIITRRTPPEEDFQLRKWHHIVVTYRMRDNQQRIYIDGVRKDVDNPCRVFGVDSTDSPVRIGNQGGEQYGNSNHFVGRIDEVRLYHRVLSPAEVGELARMHGGLAVK